MTTPTFPLRAPPGTTHSPAPWHISGQSESGRYITVKAANGRTVARVPWNGENTPLAECTDAQDALIIALAPELLAALEDMVAMVTELGRGFATASLGMGGIFRLEKAEKLAAKARGQ